VISRPATDATGGCRPPAAGTLLLVLWIRANIAPDWDAGEYSPLREWFSLWFVAAYAVAGLALAVRAVQNSPGHRPGVGEGAARAQPRRGALQ
jgi:hypothetical protein